MAANLGLPDPLLNRVNKDLKSKVDTLHSEWKRLLAIVQLESEVIRGTQEKIKVAKQHKQAAAVTLEDANKKLADENHGATVAQQSADNESKRLTLAQGQAKDWVVKVEQVASDVDRRRAALSTMQEAASRNETDALEAIAGNRIAGVESKDQQVSLDQQQQTIARLHAEAQRLVASTRSAEVAREEEEMVSTQIQRETQEALSMAAASRTEAQRLRLQIATMTERESALLATEALARQQRADMVSLQMQRREGLVEAKRDQQWTELEANKVERLMYNSQLSLADAAATFKATEMATADAERAVDQMERFLMLAITEQQKRTGENTLLRRECEAAVAGLEQLALRRASLMREAEEKGVAADDDDEAARVAERLRASVASEVERQSHIMDKGMSAIREVLSHHQAVTEQTALLQRETALRSDALTKTDNDARLLKRRLDAMSESASALEDGIADAQSQLAEATAASTRGGKTQEEVAANKSEIEHLHDVLRQLERLTVASRKAVDDATATARQATRETEQLHREISDVEADTHVLERELGSLQVDLARQKSEKHDALVVAQGLHLRTEERRRLAAAQLDQLQDGTAQRRALEAEAAAELVTIDAEYGAALTESIAVEDERRKLAATLRGLLAQQTILKSRYEHITSGLEAVVVAAERAGGRDGELVAGGAEATGRRSPTTYEAATKKASNFAALLEMVSTASPGIDAEARVGELIALAGGEVAELDSMLPTKVEELQSRWILQRGIERQSLLDRGDALDEDIVGAEKDLRTLEEALSLLRGSRAGQTVAEQLAIADAEDAVIARAVTEYAAQRVAEMERAGGFGTDAEYRATQLQELQRLSYEVASLEERLAIAKEGSALALQQLAVATAARDDAQRQVKSWEREEVRLRHAHAEEAMVTQKMGLALRAKVESTLSTRRGVESYRQAQRSMTTAAAVGRFTELLRGWRHQAPDVYAFAAQRCDTYGIEDVLPPSATAMCLIPPQQAVGHAQPATRLPPRRCTSSHGRVPSGGDRPPTVTAVRGSSVHRAGAALVVGHSMSATLTTKPLVPTRSLAHRSAPR